MVERRSLDGMPALEVLTPGRMDYEQAWELQRQLHRERVAGHRADTVVLLEHPSVYTAGRRTSEAERPVDGTSVVQVDRGGRITWHGPGQLVGYPILKLADPIDVIAYVRRIEQMLTAVCAELGLPTQAVPGRSGVWVNQNLPSDNALSEAPSAMPTRKVAAIGIRIAQGVSLHGFSLNCNPDMTFFRQIIPCGIDDATATSLTDELGRDVSIEEVIPIVSTRVSQLYSNVTSADNHYADSDHAKPRTLAG